MKNPNRIDIRVCAYALILLPPVIALVFIKLYGVNLVYADEWTIVPLIEKLYTGALTTGDLLRAHNEHRILFPRLVMLVSAHLTHFNTVAVMYCSWALALLSFGLIFMMYRRDVGGSASALLMFAPVSWMMFTLRQYESFLWGFEIQMYLCATAFVCAIYLLNKANAFAFVGAVCAGIVSTFSTANGLLVWPLGVVFIALSGMKRKTAFIVPWALIGCAIWGVYLGSGAGMSRSGDLLFLFKNPAVALTFFVLNVGSPFAFMKSSAIGMGLMVCILMLIVLAKVLGNREQDNAKWITLVLFSATSSLALAAGRAESGFWAALASRYVPLIITGSVGVYVIVLKAWTQEKTPERKQKWAMVYGAALATVFIGIVCGYAVGVVRGKEIRDIRTAVAVHLLDYEHASDNDLAPILYDVQKVREDAEILQKYGLNVFHEK